MVVFPSLRLLRIDRHQMNACLPLQALSCILFYSEIWMIFLIEIGRKGISKTTLGELADFWWHLLLVFSRFFSPYFTRGPGRESFGRWREFWIRCISSATGWLEYIGAAAKECWKSVGSNHLLPKLHATWNFRCIMYPVNLIQAATSACFDFATRTSPSYRLLQRLQVLMWICCWWNVFG